jgi:hypothetical protein
MIARLAALLATMSVVAAQPSPGCPRTKATPEEQVITFVGQQDCDGAAVSVSFGGITYSSAMGSARGSGNICPLFVIIYPKYNKSELAGDLTEAVEREQRKIWKVSFECVEYWVLGIIPVVVSAECKESGSEILGTVKHYETQACPEYAPASIRPR